MGCCRSWYLNQVCESKAHFFPLCYRVLTFKPWGSQSQTTETGSRGAQEKGGKKEISIESLVCCRLLTVIMSWNPVLPPLGLTAVSGSGT